MVNKNIYEIKSSLTKEELLEKIRKLKEKKDIETVDNNLFKKQELDIDTSNNQIKEEIKVEDLNNQIKEEIKVEDSNNQIKEEIKDIRVQIKKNSIISFIEKTDGGKEILLYLSEKYNDNEINIDLFFNTIKDIYDNELIKKYSLKEFKKELIQKKYIFLKYKKVKNKRHINFSKIKEDELIEIFINLIKNNPIFLERIRKIL